MTKDNGKAKSRFRALGGLAAAVALIAIGATAAVAVTKFTDVPNDHPHAADIAVAAERGWFSGYGDGTFKPDRNITAAQIGTVILRAYPNGLTRGQTATLLRAGDEALEEIRCPAGTALDPAPADCAMVVDGWTISFDPSSAFVSGVGCRWKSESLCDYPNYYWVNVMARNTGDESDEPPSVYRFTLYADGISWGERSRDCVESRSGPVKIAPGLEVGYSICFGADGPVPGNLVLGLDTYRADVYRVVPRS